MKSKLQSLIRQAINEVLKERENALVNTRTDTRIVPFNKPEELKPLVGDSNVSSITTTGGQKLKEDTLNEMAGINYKLADNYEEKLSELPYATSEKRMKWVNGIIDYLNQEGSKDITTIAREKFNVPQPRIADYARDMIRLGILEPAAAGVVPRFMRTDDDEEEAVEAPYSLMVGNTENPLAPYFDGEPNADGSEDFPAEEEPALPTPEEKPVPPATARSKAANFLIDNSDLIRRIIKSQEDANIRVKEAKEVETDLSSRDVRAANLKIKASAVARLEQSIQELVDRISGEDKDVQDAIIDMLAPKFASVGYASLAKKIATKVGVQAPQTPVEPEIDDLESEEEIEPLDEYAKRKLQYYAGIIR